MMMIMAVVEGGEVITITRMAGFNSLTVVVCISAIVGDKSFNNVSGTFGE